MELHLAKFSAEPFGDFRGNYEFSAHTNKNTLRMCYSETLEPAPEQKIIGLIGQAMQQCSVEASAVFNLQAILSQF